MGEVLMVGFKGGPAIPPIEENTRYVDAGALRVGVEYRYLTEQFLASESGSVMPVRDDLVKFDSEGISIHVFDSEKSLEHLRFDIFDKDAHYHYIGPDGSNQVVVYDKAACGDMWDWTKRCLLDRLTDMLVRAGADELVNKVNQATVEAAMVEIENLAMAETAGHAND